MVPGKDEAYGVRIGHVQVGRDSAPFGHLPKSRLEPAVGDVVNERKPWSRPPNELDQLRLVVELSFPK